MRGDFRFNDKQMSFLTSKVAIAVTASTGTCKCKCCVYVHMHTFIRVHTSINNLGLRNSNIHLWKSGMDDA